MQSEIEIDGKMYRIDLTKLSADTTDALESYIADSVDLPEVEPLEAPKPKALACDIILDLNRDGLFDQFGLDTLKDRYLMPGEFSPQQALARAAAAFADDQAHAQRLYEYASLQWFMFATPLLTNGGTSRGMPISCFLNYVSDSREGILSHYTENGMLASGGGGIGTYWGNVRSNKETTSKGSASSGVIPFCKVVDSEMLAFSQGKTRRGVAAVYLDVSHPEIEEWLSMRRKSGGDPNRKALNLNHGVCISDDFMRAVRHGHLWELIDPHSGDSHSVVEARALWRNILTTRMETGEPYLFFVDAANRGLPQPLKDKGLYIHASNLCTEIMLPTHADRTAVCCLSSVNLARWGSWKDHPRFIDDLMRMLDNALTFYIENAPESHWRAVASARAERSVGLGAMGFHTYLQDHGIPFESKLARATNVMFFQHIDKASRIASQDLAITRGPAPDMGDTRERFSHRMAVAPNATSAVICGGVSPSIEPFPSNAYLHKTMDGSFTVKNKSLQIVLARYGRDTPDTWKSIVTNHGSVQHLEFMSEDDKAVYRTAFEIDQMAIVGLAGDRQVYIDQGQSVNLFVPNDVHARDLHAYHMAAWESGLKALYYLRSNTIKRAELANLVTERVAVDLATCEACEG